MRTASAEVPQSDFAVGFKIGFQTAQGVSRTIAAVPADPAPPGAMTPFLMGIRVSMKAAKGTLTKPTNATPPIR